MRDIASMLAEQHAMIIGPSQTRREHNVTVEAIVSNYENFAKTWIALHTSTRAAANSLGMATEKILGLDPHAPGAGMGTAFTDYLKRMFSSADLSYYSSPRFSQLLMS